MDANVPIPYKESVNKLIFISVDYGTENVSFYRRARKQFQREE